MPGVREFMIRPAEASEKDIAAIAPLFDSYRQFYDKPPDPRVADQFIRERLTKKESVIFLAERGGEALGFVQLFPSFSSVSAFRLWVLKRSLRGPFRAGPGRGARPDGGGAGARDPHRSE